MALLASVSHAQLLDTQTWSAQDAANQHSFGHAVAMGGGHAIVAAGGHSLGTGAAGAAYIFSIDTGQQTAKLVPSDLVDSFGRSVAVSATHALVGADLDDANGHDSGSAYLHALPGGQQLMKLTAPDAAESDFFGTAVAISGDYMIVGSPQDDDSGPSSGSVYVFSIATGNLLTKLQPIDASPTSLFGDSLSVSGNLLVVGAPLHREANVSVGAAYVFSLSSGQQIAKLVAADGAESDVFGDAVAIDGTRVVVGARLDDDKGNQSGSAYIFDASTGQQLAKLVPGSGTAGDEFGAAVAISQNKVLVGSANDDDNGVLAGSAHLFSAPGGQEIAKLLASDALSFDLLGSGVAIDGVNALVGAPGDTIVPAGHQDEGTLRFYDLSLPTNFGAPYGFGDGTGALCPCSGVSDPGEGCPNDTGRGARLTAFGNAFLSNDTFRLQVSEGPSNNVFGLILRGKLQLGGGLGVPIGNGLLCTSGQTARSQVGLSSNGSTTFDNFQGAPFGASSYGTNAATNYQYWYRDTTNPCVAASFNFSNAWNVTWEL